MKFAALAIAATLSLVPAGLIAQTTASTPSPVTTTSDSGKPHNINQRKVNQQDRIAQGVKSGELTAGETSKVEHQEAGINKEESGMRAEDNGKLTAQDRKTLTAQQNQESKRIYRDKHNTRVRK